jgi:hypothetical protein
MAFSQLLLKSLDPTLPLAELAEVDDDREKKSLSLFKKSDSKPTTAQTAGKNFPVIQISGFAVTNIDTFIIDETNFIPTVTLHFTDIGGEFNGSTFPKKNLIMSTYIKVANQKFKPIRQDWLITSIRSMAPDKKLSDASSVDVDYVIKGELFVPRIYNNASRSYNGLTSKETLTKVAEELKIGFAENPAATPNDAMTWINFNTSPANFIKDVASHSFQDVYSFFTAFISKEYCLCYINVNDQLIPRESDDTFVNYSNLEAIDTNARTKVEEIDATVFNFLTTVTSSKSSPNYLTSVTLLSDQGQILKSNGYKKQIYYYDYTINAEPADKFVDFFVAPNNSDGLPESQILIPENEGLDEVGLKKWTNIEYGNAHPQWNFSRVQNDMNLKELEKIQLKVTLNGINAQVTRGSVIALIITQRVAQQLRKEFDQENPEKTNETSRKTSDETPDLQLTGKYWVKGAKYYYDGQTQKFETELILSRREWVESKKITPPSV